MLNKLSWTGTILSIIGSFMVSFHIFAAGYVFFMLGGVSWLIVGINRKDNAMITLNGVFFVANIIGLYNAVVV